VLAAANFGFGTELPTFVGVLIVMLSGALIGFANGFMVVAPKLNAFIVTLAMLIILRGMLVGATSGRTLFDLPDAFYALMTVSLLGLPLAVWLAALAFAVAGIMLRYLAQVPSFWIQAIYGAIILGSLMVARITGGEAQE
jgi:simple sugar transport system permease protein